MSIRGIQRRWWFVLAGLFILLGLGLTAGSTLARPDNIGTGKSAARGASEAPAITPTPCTGAYHYLIPEADAPHNGGTVNVGDRFTLDMMVHTAANDLRAQQAYLNFTHGVLQNVNATQSGCVLTNTVTPDSTIFELTLQNQTCNGPGQCLFDGNSVNPGSIDFASGVGLGIPSYNGPDFRLSQLAFCATAPGVATIHWEFSPPAPAQRDTEIISSSGYIVNVRSCYVDYLINVAGPTYTPTSTYTPTVTPTGNPGCNPSWSLVSSPNVGTTNSTLLAVAVVSANDMWAVGHSGTEFLGSDPYRTLIEHWDGTSWSVVPSPNHGGGGNRLHAVAAVSANDVWAVGLSMHNILIEHWNGSSWSVVNTRQPGNLRSITVVSANDIWAVGVRNGGWLIMHWDGTAWSIFPDLYQKYLNAVSAVSTNDVWAVGSDNIGQPSIVHWDGSVWSFVSCPNPGGNNDLTGVVAISANDVWAVGYHEAQSVRSTLIMHWDGTQWSIVSSPNPGTVSNALQAVTAISANEVMAVGYRQDSNNGYYTLTERWDGSQWSVVNSPNANQLNNYLNGVADVSLDGEMWAVGSFWNGDVPRTQVLRYTPGSCPNATMTPTATLTPSLMGHVTWDGRDPQPDPSQIWPITLTLRLVSGGPYINYPTQNTDANGVFTVTVDGLPSGDYYWWAKGPLYLANSGTLTLTGAPITQVEMGLMLAGDSNGDNADNIADFNIVKNTYGLSCPDPEYDSSGDFTGDCRVNILDFNQLKRNFGMTGAPRYWGP